MGLNMKFKLLIITLILVGFLACDRIKRDYAGTKRPADAPQYQAVPNQNGNNK